MDDIKLFFSYSHKDEKYRSSLEAHLSLLVRRNIISSWHDRKIPAGNDWKSEIDDNLKTADIILLLISSDFIASDYCYDIELDIALQRHESKDAIVIPIILRPSDWSDAPFSRIQALPTDAVPISKWESEDEAWLTVVKELKLRISDIQKQKDRVNEIQTHNFKPLNQLITEELEAIDQAFNLDSRQTIRGIPTGLRDLDEMIDGINRSELTVISGRSDMGQSSLALQLAFNASAGQNIPTAIFSLDLPKEKLMRRLLSMTSIIPQHKLVTGALEEEDWPRLASGISILKDKPVFIDDSISITYNELHDKCERAIKNENVELVLIDGLQRLLFNNQRSQKEDIVNNVSKQLSELARKHNIAIILTCNLGRHVDQRSNKRPLLSDLNSFGSLSDDAGTILFVYRNEVYCNDPNNKGIAELIVAKNSSLEIVGEIKLASLLQFSKFSDLNTYYN